MNRASIAAAVLILIFSILPGRAQEMSRLSELIEAWLASPHADHRSESFTHWDDQAEVPVDCAACHSGPGFVDFLGADGTAPGKVDHPAPVQSPIGCVACHTTAAHELDAATFPSGFEATGLGASATCMVCHQGRQSTGSVDEAISDLGEDEVSADLAFVNIHYRAAAATMLGSEARGGYEYAGRKYSGRFNHVPSANSCVACHDPHTTEVATEGCLSCHQGVDELTAIRTRHADFDGDGNRAEGIHGEIATLHERLLEAMFEYATQVAGAPIVHAPGSYPYFFADSDGDGQADDGETVYPNRYRQWTPRLLRAAYNYQFAASDPGGYVHNPVYLLQLLHDSLDDLSDSVGIDMSRIDRP